MRIPQLLLALSFVSAAAAADPSQTHYSFFNRTPAESMREMTTDRLGATETPYTINAGHAQVETDLIRYSITSDESFGTVRDYTFYGWAPKLRFGLCERAEVQLQAAYSHFQTDFTNPTFPAANYSYSEHWWMLTPAVKINILGNDEGPFALALTPFVTTPLTKPDYLTTEFGLKVPLAIKLPEDFSLRLMSGFQTMEVQTSSRRYDTYFVRNSINLSKRFEKLTVYTEFATALVASRPDRWGGFVDFGAGYQVTKDLQLDAGIAFGVTDNSADYNPFAGFSYRF
jgi:hypothetical protein